MEQPNLIICSNYGYLSGRNPKWRQFSMAMNKISVKTDSDLVYVVQCLY